MIARPAIVFAALVVALLVATRPGAAMMNRVCDGRPRHVDCRFVGGSHLVADVPPGEILTYATPTLVFLDHGRIRIVVGECEIDCEPSRLDK